MDVCRKCVLNRQVYRKCRCLLYKLYKHHHATFRYSSSAASAEKYKVNISEYGVERIRNLSIIAHIDHGKSTLADRLLEQTGTISDSVKNSQVLDKLQVERERGITVKAQTASLVHKHSDGNNYLINLIDTPGHVDFSFEVSRSLNACQGVVLLVDANQGVQAQTVANFYLAWGKEMTIIPVLNKIDLPGADPDAVARQMEDLFDIPKEDIIKVSAKHGTGVDVLLSAIISRIPPPLHCCPSRALKALLFDSYFDQYRGVVALMAVQDGRLSTGDVITSAYSRKDYEVKGVGILHPDEIPMPHLSAGQVGYVSCKMRTAKEAHLGDTFHHRGVPVDIMAEFAPAKPMVYAGVFPMESAENEALASAIEKLILTDASVQVKKESSPALGQGWRIGFLGLLHLEVFNQRLEQEYGMPVVVTTPSVPYKVHIKPECKSLIKQYGGELMILNNPMNMPDRQHIERFEEPMVIGTIITPDSYLGPVLRLCEGLRSTQLSARNIDNSRIILQHKFPLSEIATEFFDQLKSVTSGYASFDYEDAGYEETDLVKVDILLNKKIVEEFSFLVHPSKARDHGRTVAVRLKETIHRQMFQIDIQAAVNNKVIARETIKQYRKDVTAKCYGGDVSRKMKLLKNQAEGKKKMKMIGNIEIDRGVFLKVLKRAT